MFASRSALAICILAYLMPEAVTAQEARESALPNDGDIIVTARRTAERLQDVPVAVTAFTAESIERRQMRSVSDIQQLTPSLNVTTGNAQGSKGRIALRGQRQAGSGINVDPSVGVYINEVYAARDTFDGVLYDLESIQVLKGPQGTLFGRNTTGGALLVSTKKPGDYFGGYVRGAIEDPWAYSIEGAVNVPLGDGNALRISGIRHYRQGYTKIVNWDTHADDRDRWGVRGSLKIVAGDLESLFMADYYRWNERANGVYPLVRISSVAGSGATVPLYTAYDAALAANRQGFADRRVNTSLPSISRGRNYSASNITTYPLNDDITIKNIVGYSATRDYNRLDFDATEVNILLGEQAMGQHQFTEELQLQGKSFDNALDWIVGAYYFQERGFDQAPASVFNLPIPFHVGTNNLFHGRNNAKSVFAHASYTLPIGVPAHIFGGIRRSYDTRKIVFETYSDLANGGRSCQVQVPDPANPSQGVPIAAGFECAVHAQKKYSAWTWDVGVDIKPVDDLLLYASVSRGFRTGGFNGRATTLGQQLPFNPETITNYETGLKYSGRVGDMRTMFNAALYHSTYNNIQQSLIVASPFGITSSIINAAKGRINGLELEFSVQPVEALTLSGFYSLTDAKYTEFRQLGIDISDNKFAGVPKHQGGGAVAVEFLDNDDAGRLSGEVGFRFQSGYNIDPINVPGGFIPKYHLFNANLRLEKAFGSRATIEAYVKNLANRRYASGGFSSPSLGFVVQTLAEPRVFGLSVRLPFGEE